MNKPRQGWLVCVSDPDPQGGYYREHYKNICGALFRVFPPADTQAHWVVLGCDGQRREFSSEDEAFANAMEVRP